MPTVKTIINEEREKEAKIKGRRRATSTSKTKKTTIIRKNFRQKGKREMLLGSKPHSKGEVFSLSFKDL